MNVHEYRDLWLSAAIAFALVAVWVSVLLSARRTAKHLAHFGPPPFSPVAIGLTNLLPGLGLNKMGWPLKKVIIHSAIIYLVIAGALAWPRLGFGERLKLIAYAVFASAIHGERVATEAWKNKINQSTPPA